MINPFQYGGIVEKETFCNRKYEINDLTRFIDNGEKIFIYSERRVGKTSLIKQLFNKLSRKSYLPIYVDLWPTDDESSFIKVTAKAITEALETKTERLLKTAKTFFGGFLPVIALDSEGKPQLNFRWEKRKVEPSDIEEVFNAAVTISRKKKLKAVIVLDEIQRVLEYNNDLIERKLRSIVQLQKNVSYIFMGSRKSLITKMFLEKSRPLYKSGGHYSIKEIELKHWIPFISKKFSNFGKKIKNSEIEKVIQITAGHPFYTQHLCHILWEICEKGVTDEIILKSINILLERESYAFTSLWDTLTANQKRVLKGLSVEDAPQVFSSEFLIKHKIGQASNGQRVIKSLLKKDFIDYQEGSYKIVDKFFQLWIKRVCENEN